MEDIRELIIIGGGVLIVAIVVHGLWVAWRNRNALHLRIEPNLVPEEADDNWLSADFPNGGARLRKGQSATRGPHEADPQGLAEDSYVADGATTQAAPPPREGEAIPPPQPVPLFASEPILRTGTKGRRPQGPTAADLVAAPEATTTSPEASAPSVAGADLGGEPTTTAPEEAAPAKQSWQTELAKEAGDTGPTDDPLMLVHVLAPQGERFDGAALMRALRAENLKYGRMQIFHRADPQTQKCRFSIANAVEPGYFDLGKDCTSPGVTAFLHLTDGQDNATALDDMLHTAHSLARSLGGTLLDDHRRPFTQQTLAEYRNRAADFA